MSDSGFFSVRNLNYEVNTVIQVPALLGLDTTVEKILRIAFDGICCGSPCRGILETWLVEDGHEFLTILEIMGAGSILLVSN